jgi:uncharacterized membrane protein
VFESLAPLASAGVRYVPTLVLLWLAFLFGRTLQRSEVPLIERIARLGKPVLSAALCRYARGLTALWSLYFVIAALLPLAAGSGFRTASLGVASMSALLFVGEYWARVFVFFRREPFPGLLQQARDSVRACRPGGA